MKKRRPEKDNWFTKGQKTRKGRCQVINPDLTPDPLLFLTCHAICLTPNMNKSSSLATYMSEDPHYVMFHNMITHNLNLLPHPHYNVLLILLWNTLSYKILQTAILTHARELVPRTAQCAGSQTWTRTSFRPCQQHPGLPFLIPQFCSDSVIRFSSKTNCYFFPWFALSSQIRLISLYNNMQTNFPPAFLSGSKQSWCCCQENLLPDLLPCRTAGQVLY